MKKDINLSKKNTVKDKIILLTEENFSKRFLNTAQDWKFKKRIIDDDFAGNNYYQDTYERKVDKNYIVGFQVHVTKQSYQDKPYYALLYSEPIAIRQIGFYSKSRQEVIKKAISVCNNYYVKHYINSRKK